MPTKFKNQKCEYDGMLFDSKFERDVYITLRQDDTIERVFCQVPFYLMPPVVVAYKRDGEKKRKKTVSQRLYKMDFVVLTTSGEWHAIEAKGIATDVWTLKRDLLIWQYLTCLKTWGLPTDIAPLRFLSQYTVIYQAKAREDFRAL